MERSATGELAGSEIHGFRTMEDLDVMTMIEEARTRWLRPNEIHALLSNYNYFCIEAKPVNLPESGKIVWYDRKKLRNFRKDGHNWKKRKDRNAVMESHEFLRVGNDNSIHVYYAHVQDNPTFVRRCYWLLDKTLEHIVLVHYRETQELQVPPVMPGGDSAIKNQERILNELNTREWEELLVTNDPNNSIAPKEDEIVGFQQQNQYPMKCSKDGGSPLLVDDLSPSSSWNPNNLIGMSNSVHYNFPDSTGFVTMQDQLNLDVQRKDSVPVGTGDSLDILVKDGLQTQDSFGRCLNSIMIDSPGSVDYKSQLEQFRFQMRLAHLLFSTSKSINILSSEVSQNVLKEAEDEDEDEDKTSNIASGSAYLIKSIDDNKISFPQAKDRFIELVLKNKLQEWLEIVGRRSPTECDDQGQGVIHLCAILGYTQVVKLFSSSGLSLDHRDKFGWTSLHWAAYCGREKMVEALVLAGAGLNLLTYSSPEKPFLHNAADLAQMKGYDRLVAYLEEKGLSRSFQGCNHSPYEDSSAVDRKLSMDGSPAPS